LHRAEGPARPRWSPRASRGGSSARRRSAASTPACRDRSRGAGDPGAGPRASRPPSRWSTARASRRAGSRCPPSVAASSRGPSRPARSRRGTRGPRRPTARRDPPPRHGARTARCGRRAGRAGGPRRARGSRSPCRDRTLTALSPGTTARPGAEEVPEPAAKPWPGAAAPPYGRGMTTLDDAALADLDTRLRAAADADAFSGVVRIERDGAEVFERAYGLASRRWGVPVRPSTRFDVASVTKLFTAVAVLQLVGDGRLGLDDRVHDHVDLAGTTIPREVTIRHLLTHTSGIADDADEEAGESYEALWVDRPSYSVTRTADFLPGFVHKEPNFPPGEGCRYCNVGFVLAGLALEAVTGTTYRDHVREHVFARAGMDRSGFFRMDEAEPDRAGGREPVRRAARGPGRALRR